MSRKKNERPQSPMEFTAAAEKLVRKVYEDTRFNFGIKDEPDALDGEGEVIPGRKFYTENKDFIQKTKEQMLMYAEMVDFYVQTADSHYPHTLGILEERRKMLSMSSEKARAHFGNFWPESKSSSPRWASE